MLCGYHLELEFDKILIRCLYENMLFNIFLGYLTKFRYPFQSLNPSYLSIIDKGDKPGCIRCPGAVGDCILY